MNRIAWLACIWFLVSAGAMAQSLGTLARRERQARARVVREAPVYTNDNLPQQGDVSVLGQPAAPSHKTNTAKANTAGSHSSGSDAAQESAWKQRFAAARRQLAMDQQDLRVSQRQLGLDQLQYYSDPSKAMQQQYSNSDLVKDRAHIADVQKRVAADQAHIDQLTDELRKAGLPAGWSR